MQTLAKTVITLISATIMSAALAQGTPPTTTKKEEVKKEEVSTVGIMPHRGMTMEQVKQSFGEPKKTIAPVGKPPITRWIYEGFIVYFEDGHVIHSLATADSTQ